MRFRFRSVLASLPAMLVPLAVSAQGSFVDRVKQGTNNAATPAGLINTGDLPHIIGNIIYVMLSFTGIVLLLIMLYSGFLWMTAGGDSKKVEQARAMIMNAFVGLLIVTASYAIVNFVLSSLIQVGSGTGGGSTGQGA